jgi:DNA repair protein RecN (Recombination protein N)
MLKTLHIRDYALIDRLDIEFGPGFNILTGETGAGKSIIIGAFGLLLGEKGRTDSIRQDAPFSMVEGTFQIPPFLIDVMAKFDINGDGNELVLRREVHRTGKSRCFANDSPITQATLSALGDLLVDLHGQHDHQSLLKTEYHLETLDTFGVPQDPLDALKLSFRKFRTLSGELDALREKEQKLRQQRDLVEFQIQQIAKINPLPGEEETLVSEEKILSHSEKLSQIASNVSGLLYAGESSITEKLSAAENDLANARDIDPRFESWITECRSLRIAAEEIGKSMQEYASKIEFNPQRLEEVRERLGAFTLLKKKYGNSMEQVLEFWKKSKEELQTGEQVGTEILHLTQEVDAEKQTLSRRSEEVSKFRKKAALLLEKETVHALGELGLKGGVFQISLTRRENPDGPVIVDDRPYAATAKGIDAVEFIISLNPGEDPKPLARVASGGEISRIMLALKSVLAETDRIPVLVFDEIDTGISGRIARVVGRNLKNIAQGRQVICITHLAQIASLADRHFCVEKTVHDNRSKTTVRMLEPKDRIPEIAKLIGGEKITDSSIQSARELIEAEDMRHGLDG